MNTFLLRPGLVVAVPVACFRHVGIVTARMTVISCSRRRGCVAEESVAEFANGGAIAPIDYPGKLSPSEVVWRARSMMGTRWHPFKFNCEHFVKRAHGLEPESPQLQAAVALSLIVLVVFVSIGTRTS